MRWFVVGIILLAGCAEAPAPVVEGPDPSIPIYGGTDIASLYLYGPDANETGDGRAFMVRCAGIDNLLAYTFPARFDNKTVGSVPLTLLAGETNATSFVFAAFVDSPAGLVADKTIAGGSAGFYATAHDFAIPATWPERLPDVFSAPVGSDGMVRIAIACEGDGAANYRIDGPQNPETVDYLEPVLATGLDAFLAYGSSSLAFYIPPSTTTVAPPAWTLIGDVTAHYSQTGPGGARIGETRIEWGARNAGWTTAACHHQGFADTGSWRYEADFGNGAESQEGVVFDHIATLGLSQQLVDGAIDLVHADNGASPPKFSFSVQHQASSEFGWATWCEGAHLGAPLDVLFGESGARQWEMPDGIL